MKPDSNVVVTTLDDGSAVLLHLKTKEYFTLNAPAARIWTLLVEEKNPHEICAALEAEYRVDRDRASRSVTQFIDSLQSNQLLRP